MITTEEGKPTRYERRLLLRKGGRRNEKTSFADNIGTEYDFLWAAKGSSFLNILMGCLKNGFPVAVSKLWYAAWAFYPFFFVRKDLKVEDPIAVLNHERIHVRQQRELHMTLSLPLLICALWSAKVLIFVPFVPTIIYFAELLRVYIKYHQLRNKGLNALREQTCFEREAISRSTNALYLHRRKFFAFLAYTSIKRFKNYGIK